MVSAETAKNHMTAAQYDAQYTPLQQAVNKKQGVVEVTGMTGNLVTSYTILGMPADAQRIIKILDVLPSFMAVGGTTNGNKIIVHPFNINGKIIIKFVSAYAG